MCNSCKNGFRFPPCIMMVTFISRLIKVSCKNVYKYNWKPPLHNVGIIMFAVCMSAF
jgi:hypothetical protein